MSGGVPVVPAAGAGMPAAAAAAPEQATGAARHPAQRAGRGFPEPAGQPGRHQARAGRSLRPGLVPFQGLF